MYCQNSRDPRETEFSTNYFDGFNRECEGYNNIYGATIPCGGNE